MSSEASTRSGRTGAARRLLAGGRGDVVDRLARLAAEALDAPYCEISLYTDRQFKVGVHGLTLEPGERERPLQHSFCSIPVLSGAPLALEDARADPRVRDRPALAGGLARGYLGVPVRVGREVVGALCVFGPEPRRWTEHEVELLSTLSESVATEFELSGAVAALVESSARLDLGFAAANIGSFDWNLDTDELQWDARLMALFG
jgi:GAF domain-containing protein